MHTPLTWALNTTDQQLIDLALQEDLGFPFNDITTSLLFTKADRITHARIVTKDRQPIVLCGLPVVYSLLTKLSDQCLIQSDFQDGDTIQPNTTFLTLIGPANILVMVERTLLNFLQHLCAIATLTTKFVNLVQHTNAKILDTRKTLPGFRHLDKYAVQCGGGINHRMGLYDAIMLKDTHIDLLGGMEKTLNILPKKNKAPVIVEVRTLLELEIVLTKARHKITRVLLDNMSASHRVESVKLCQSLVPTEASGNITLNNVVAVAECGVDFISVGQLTHSAGSVDLSMKCDI